MELSHERKELALEIATKLDDLGMLHYHDYLVTQHTEEYLRDRLDYVLAKPKEQITNSRAAAYISLVNKYPHFKYKRPRN